MKLIIYFDEKKKSHENEVVDTSCYSESMTEKCKKRDKNDNLSLRLLLHDS